MPLYDQRGPERLLDLQIRTGAFGDRYGERKDGLTLESFRQHPHGIDMGPLVPRLDEILATPSGKVELAPPHITADVPRLAARLDRAADEMVLVSRRHLRSNNSWLHNVESMVRGRDRCTLLIHPGDAARCGVADGERAIDNLCGLGDPPGTCQSRCNAKTDLEGALVGHRCRCCRARITH